MPEADPITAAIESSVAAATEAPDSPDVVDDAVAETPAAEEAVSPSAGDTSVSDDAAKAAAAEKAELDLYGVKPPKEGERENRLPYTRHKKIVDNAIKRAKEEHATALKAEADKYTQAQERLKNLDNWDRLIANDPDRAISELARLHPALYKKFLNPPAAAVEAPKPVAEEPPPHDWKYEDGTTSYSPAGQAKFLEWQGRQLETKIKGDLQKEYDKRFGPIENQWKAQQVINEKLPVVRQQIASAKTTWGDLFTKNEPEILKYLQDYPQVGFADAVATVLVPKAQANRDSMRAELIKEINARPRAAVKAAPVAAVAAVETGPKSMEDVIRESIKGLK